VRRTALAALAAALAAACSEPPPAPDDGWKPDPQPETADFRLVVAAEPRVELGGDLVFRVKVENHGAIAARLNVPRLGRDSVSFKVRSDSFDTAWLDPIPVKETPRGNEPSPPEVREVPPGGSVEGEIRQAAVLCGKFTFAPVYSCQALPGPLAGEPVKVEVVPASGMGSLGVRLETTHGTIDVKLRPDLAFQTCTSFATLVKSGFYDGVRFHRIVAGFMAQGGDPTGEGWGGPGYAIRRELHGRLPHRRGVISMARQRHPDTAGSQFFLMFRDDPNLDRGGYTTFGEMVSGNDTLQRLESLGSNAPDGGDQSPKEPVSIRKASIFLVK
jgi:peptidyl-prolyl cis-trans isomerase B (cyclophilin B)